MKRRWLWLAAVALLLVAGWLWLRVGSLGKKIASETFDAAIVADDGDHADRAAKLFAEACNGGSDKACRVVRKK